MLSVNSKKELRAQHSGQRTSPIFHPCPSPPPPPPARQPHCPRSTTARPPARPKPIRPLTHPTGFTPLSKAQRQRLYADSSNVDLFDEAHFAMVDTLFSLAEAYLFMQLVELRDGDPGALPAGKSYADLYRDLRTAVDLCHRYGSNG